MRFIEDAGTYCVYERDGQEVYVAPGGPPWRFLVEFDTDWMIAQWQEYSRTRWISVSVFRDFRDALRDQVIDPDTVDDLDWCRSCETPALQEDGQYVGRHNDEFACDSCIQDNYSSCNDCDTLARSDNMSFVYDDAVCSRCLDNYYSWCDHCDQYYHHDYSADHDHESEGCMENGGCESPVQRFAVRFGEGEVLFNDERRTVTLEAGTIDSQGKNRIHQLLNSYENEAYYQASYLLEELGDQWQTRDGNYTRRLSRLAYNRYQLRIPDTLLQQVGNIAREHSMAPSVMVAVTRDLNMDPQEFGNSGSCWWESYTSSRCALKTNGGWGLRSFDEHGYVSGRAWVMPLKWDEGGRRRLVPTFNSETPDGFMVFNCYGKMQNLVAPRVVAQMAGMAYKRVQFSSSPMYINSEMGYLVLPQEQLNTHRDHVSFELDAHADLFEQEQLATRDAERVMADA